MSLLLILTKFDTFFSVSIVALSVYFSKDKYCSGATMKDFTITGTENVNTEEYPEPFKKELFPKYLTAANV